MQQFLSESINFAPICLRGLINAGGGSLPSGSETVALSDFAAQPNDRLGDALPGGIGFADMTDDGVLDVIAAAPSSDQPARDAGRLILWAGEPFMSSFPTATFENFNGAQNDRLGDASVGFQFADLNDDGVPDLLVGAQDADISGIVNSGGIFLWLGSSSISGSVLPDAVLEGDNPAAGDRLGR